MQAREQGELPLGFENGTVMGKARGPVLPSASDKNSIAMLMRFLLMQGD